LSRLLARVDAGGPASSDAAARLAHVVTRLDRDDLDW